MKQLFNRAAASATAALFALALAGLTPNAARAGAYCRTDVSAHMMGCAYDTMEQCQAMSSGRGGDCTRNPFLANPGDALAYAPKHPSDALAYAPKHAKAKKPAAH
jgi:hypothetical protein